MRFFYESEIRNDFLSEYKNFKLSHLLNGLAYGFNIEMRMNELYNYITSCTEKTIIANQIWHYNSSTYRAEKEGIASIE